MMYSYCYSEVVTSEKRTVLTIQMYIRVIHNMHGIWIETFTKLTEKRILFCLYNFTFAASVKLKYETFNIHSEKTNHRFSNVNTTSTTPLTDTSSLCIY